MEESETSTFDHDTIQTIPAIKPSKTAEVYHLKMFPVFDYSSLLRLPKVQETATTSNEDWLDSVI